MHMVISGLSVWLCYASWHCECTESYTHKASSQKAQMGRKQKHTCSMQHAEQVQNKSFSQSFSLNTQSIFAYCLCSQAPGWIA